MALILQMRNLRQRELKEHHQGHTASKWGSGFKLGNLAIKLIPLITHNTPRRQVLLPSPQMDHFCVYSSLVPPPESSSFSPIDFFLLNFLRSPPFIP